MFNKSLDKSKERILRDICQNHSARSDRDAGRICPTKLTRQELEDIYYTLVDDNFHMKHKIMSLEEKVKSLTTKLLRMTNAQKSTISKEEDHHSASKTLLFEQKEQIEDLQSANRKLVERIKLLRMQMCSAKQFFSTSSQGSRCPKCFIRSSTIALNSKRSVSSLKQSTSCQYIDKEVMTSRSIQCSVAVNTENPDKVIINESIDQKYVIQGEQMRQKIADLEQELANASEKYAMDISKLEQLGISLRQDNVNLRSQITLKQEMLQDLSHKICAMELDHSDLSSQLILEKRKVTELETQLKVCSVSGNIARAVEEHLSQVKIDAIKEQIELKKRLDKMDVRHDQLGSKCSDDSGFTETKSIDSDHQFLAKQNKELLRQVEDLQIQIEALQSENMRMKQKMDTPSPKRHSIVPVAVESIDRPGSSINSEVVLNPSTEKTSSKLLAQESSDSDTKHSTIKANDAENEQFAAFFVNIENTSSPNIKISNSEKETTKLTSAAHVTLDKVQESPKENITNKVNTTKSIDSDSDRKDRTKTLSNSQSKPNSKHEKRALTSEKPIKTNVRKTDSNNKQKTLEIKQRSSSGSAKTYIVPGSGRLDRVSRQDSPYNTDCEISSLSDLPSERDERQPPSILSPGEDRMHLYSSDTYQTSTTDYGSLSEGELPGFRIDRQLSVGEKQIGGFRSREFNGTCSRSEMQRAVTAAATELARCRHLLRINKRVPT